MRWKHATSVLASSGLLTVGLAVPVHATTNSGGPTVTVGWDILIPPIRIHSPEIR